jgi:hypothetical protein
LARKTEAYWSPYRDTLLLMKRYPSVWGADVCAITGGGVGAVAMQTLNASAAEIANPTRRCRAAALEADLIDPLFQKRHGMPDAVSGGNGLFLMPKQFIADIGRATGGP